MDKIAFMLAALGIGLALLFGVPLFALMLDLRGYW